LTRMAMLLSAGVGRLDNTGLKVKEKLLKFV
jgi:hypothetical protein